MATLTLKPGRERSLLRRHPWVFSGAVARVEGAPAPGDTVDIRAADGAWMARGAYSPSSQIRARVWTFRGGEEIGPGFFSSRVTDAFLRRTPFLEGGGVDALRLIHSENDGLPGVVVDRYGPFLVVQLLSTGAEAGRNNLARGLEKGWEALLPGVPLGGIYERSDPEVRAKEGLEPRAGVLVGEEPPELVEIREGDFRFLVDLRRGHKTGFYLDQRENRRLVQEVARRPAWESARGLEVLNAFAYTGGFGIAALAGGAEKVLNLEASGEAVELGNRIAELNGIPRERWESRQGDAFRLLRALKEEGRSFDLVILDPPKFAEARGQVEGASRGYKDINLQAFGLLRPGGLLFTFSCSGHMPPELFQKIVSDAALDAGREGRILRRLEQGPDHPTSLAFPEGSYLKGLMVQVE
jgi:23S rRNA (cytosine1962-C5)-methyltransferase